MLLNAFQIQLMGTTQTAAVGGDIHLLQAIAHIGSITRARVRSSNKQANITATPFNSN
jgi:molybdenum-dependent DNA-binding transcriptional regulator ModE